MNILITITATLLITACTLVLNSGTLKESPNAGVSANDNIVKGEK